MAYKLKDKYKTASVDSIYKPLDQLTQKDIGNLQQGIRDLLFEEIATKKKDAKVKK
tara:strand:+ start:4990 stop:5157 length:168 start_codon:yes stop_codon:yes gene_type:complete